MVQEGFLEGVTSEERMRKTLVGAERKIEARV